MCSGMVCGVTTLVLGAALVIASSIVGFLVIPGIVENGIINEVILLNDTEQLERFKQLPMPLSFSIRLFNISNAEEVLEGAVPELTEVGPYTYKMYHGREVEGMEEDLLRYRLLSRFEFDPEASYPYSEDDLVHVTNIAYHGVLQAASELVPGLMPLLNLAMDGIFGDRNAPIAAIRVGDLLFDGIKLCEGPGIVGGLACGIIRDLSESIQNMAVQEDNSIEFSVMGYRNNKPGSLLEVARGIEDHFNLGRITALNGLPELLYWAGADVNMTGSPTVCNMINGTDSGIFHPFIDTEEPLYALNTDICRSVELRYQYDVEYQGVPAVRYSANEWYLNNDDGCFCLNRTEGVTRENGCLLQGAMEMYSCVGAFMVMSYPHFLYADMRYRNGVLGLNPIEEDHRIFLDLEPNTGTVVRGAKRGQFNVFMRPIAGIPATQNLRTTLTPLLWIEEGIQLTEEFTDRLSSDLLSTLSLVNILVPVAVALSAAVLLTGITIIACVCCKSKKA